VNVFVSIFMLTSYSISRSKYANRETQAGFKVLTAVTVNSILLLLQVLWSMMSLGLLCLLAISPDTVTFVSSF
jgi:hypothetical protein